VPGQVGARARPPDFLGMDGTEEYSGEELQVESKGARHRQGPLLVQGLRVGQAVRMGVSM